MLSILIAITSKCYFITREVPVNRPAWAECAWNQDLWAPLSAISAEL